MAIELGEVGHWEAASAHLPLYAWTWDQTESMWKGHPVWGRSVLHPYLPLCRHRAQTMGWPVALWVQTVLSVNLPRHRRSSYSFLYSSVTLLSSTDQVRKIRSSLSTLLFAHGYKPQVAAGCICQHVNMTSAGVCHSNVACLKSYVYHIYHWTFTTTKMLVAIRAWQQQLRSLPLERQQGGQSLLSCWLQFPFRWTRGRCCRGDFWSHALCVLSQPQAKQTHVFHSAESSDNHHCLTSRRIHHCWASCLEMLMLLCGFFRTLGQHLPHQTYLSFAALSQPALYSRCNLFSMNDKPGGPQR